MRHSQTLVPLRKLLPVITPVVESAGLHSDIPRGLYPVLETPLGDSDVEVLLGIGEIDAVKLNRDRRLLPRQT